MTRLERDVERLAQFAVDRPEGFNYRDVDEALGWDRQWLLRVVRELRLRLQADHMTLTADPAGQREPWLYRLVGDYDGSRPWGSNREHDMLTRLRTMVAYVTPIVRNTDGRSLRGRRARLIESTLSNLLVQLETMEETLDDGR